MHIASLVCLADLHKGKPPYEEDDVNHTGNEKVDQIFWQAED